MLVPAADRPEHADGEFHLLDLVGLEALLPSSDEAIGTVSNLISGGNDLLEIELNSGKMVIIPFVEAIVPEVQLEEGWLLLTTPPGCWSWAEEITRQFSAGDPRINSPARDASRAPEQTQCHH